MQLNIKIDPTNREIYDYLNNLYTEHNHYHEGDSGLDLYCPEDITIDPGETKRTSSPIREKDQNRLAEGSFDGYVVHIELSECGEGEEHGSEGSGEHGGAL